MTEGSDDVLINHIFKYLISFLFPPPFCNIGQWDAETELTPWGRSGSAALQADDGSTCIQSRPPGESAMDTHTSFLRCEMRLNRLAPELHYPRERPVSTCDLESMPGVRARAMLFRVPPAPHPRNHPGPVVGFAEAMAEHGRGSPKELPQAGGTRRGSPPAGESPSNVPAERWSGGNEREGRPKVPLT